MEEVVWFLLALILLVVWLGFAETELATVTFNVLEGASGPTVFKMVKTSTPPDYDFDGQSFNVAISP
jgi:hypothetical protein